MHILIRRVFTSRHQSFGTTEYLVRMVVVVVMVRDMLGIYKWAHNAAECTRVGDGGGQRRGVASCGLNWAY